MGKLCSSDPQSLSFGSMNAYSFPKNLAGNCDEGANPRAVASNSSPLTHTAGPTSEETTALPLFEEASIKSIAIGTVPSASSCCEELYILLDEEPLPIVQSTFGHKGFSGMSSFLGTSTPSSFGLCALIRVSTSLSDGGDGGGVGCNRPPVLERPFDRFNLLPPFYDIERHSHETFICLSSSTWVSVLVSSFPCLRWGRGIMWGG